MTEVGYSVAFAAGALSFLSPCVLALVPGYLVMLTSMTGNGTDKDSSSSRKLHTLVGAFIFILGFSIVFISLGAAATGVGGIFRHNRSLFRYAGGLLIIVFGLQTTGLLRIKAFYRQYSPISTGKRTGLLGCLITGISFAFGWTPCVGPILGSILTLAGQTGGVAKGVLLLTAYSLGLSIPFILSALLVDRLRPFTSRALKNARIIELISGLLLIGVGILLITDSFYIISSRLLDLTGSWSPDSILDRFIGSPKG